MKNSLKYYRTKAKISQRRLSAMVGMSHTYLCLIEKGQRMPRIDKTVKICEILRVNAFTLFPEYKALINTFDFDIETEADLIKAIENIFERPIP